MALISVSNNALQNITAVPASVASGALILLSTQTANSSASIEFTSGIDSTYDSYIFSFINLNPDTATQFRFNGSANGGVNYNQNIQSTAFQSFHREDDSSTSLNYRAGDDLTNGTDTDGNPNSYAILTNTVGSNSDESCSGYLQIFNPSSTTYVKHFISRIQVYYNRTGSDSASHEQYYAGYFNTTSAINAFDFKFNTGNFDGVIKLYGVK